MRYAFQWLRSLIFAAQMYVMLVVFAVAFFPFALFSPNIVYVFLHSYTRYVRWTLSWMTGIKTEIRGNAPDYECLVASKHQSFLDVFLILSAVPRVRFIIKRELHILPIFHYFGNRIGNVPVKRGDRGKAIKKMMADVQSGKIEAGQLVIYPQGTRVAPGVSAPYKIGVGLIYEQTGQDCVPVATNVGLFWPKRGVYRKPGVAVIEFLPPIKSGKPREEFMKELEQVIEQNSDRLMAEAGFKG
ncbi:MAG TPA: 1-acyl-sn-glycerol-3-phosphate acyltransferase [Rhodobacteraceae bacterium]|jgi:1-acyl-sn-glycerol-3-phosphate acyltransferase|nr:1-acyl-sn-glycerol-3-phosphate acyltransferase [Paracoccaceae bacterium]